MMPLPYIILTLWALGDVLEEPLLSDAEREALIRAVFGAILKK